MEYDTKNIEVRARMDDVAHAIKAMPAVSRLSQTHNGHMFSRKPTGFNATLKCYMSKQHGGCGKAQEATVLLTHSRTALLACLDELRREKNGIFFFGKRDPFLQVLLCQGWVPNVCLQWSWITRTVHFTLSRFTVWCRLLLS